MLSEVKAMLLQFRVKNYRSIGDEITIDLTAGRGKEHPHFLHEQNKVKILPVISMYGSNASGKTNIIQALSDMFINVSQSYRNGIDAGDRLKVVPFLYDDVLKTEPTEMEIFFTLDGQEYQYGYKTTPDRIHEEWLYSCKLSQNDTVSKPIFVREGDEIQFAKPYANLNIFNELIGYKNLALSFIINRSSKDIDESEQVFHKIGTWFRTNFYWHESVISDEEIYRIYTSHDGMIKDSFLSFLQEFDPLIEDIIFKSETNKDGASIFKTYTVHNGNEYPIEIESVGTQKLFRLYVFLFAAMNVISAVMSYDELDTHLHPLILRRIVNMFHDKEINKMNSQLIFTSHNLIVLNKDELRRDEIWFVEKDERGFTTAYSLDSFKSTKDEVRADMDYGKHYLYGRFGAIPYARPRGKAHEWKKLITEAESEPKKSQIRACRVSQNKMAYTL